MATVNVRLLADDVVRDLKLRAAHNNRSLEGEVRNILEGAVKNDMAAKCADFLKRTAELRREMSRLQTPSEHLIREDRDHGH